MFLTKAVGWEPELCSLWLHWAECALVWMWVTLGYWYRSQGWSL